MLLGATIDITIIKTMIYIQTEVGYHDVVATPEILKQQYGDIQNKKFNKFQD